MKQIAIIKIACSILLERTLKAWQPYLEKKDFIDSEIKLLYHFI